MIIEVVYTVLIENLESLRKNKEESTNQYNFPTQI